MEQVFSPSLLGDNLKAAGVRWPAANSQILIPRGEQQNRPPERAQALVLRVLLSLLLYFFEILFLLGEGRAGAIYSRALQWLPGFSRVASSLSE